MIRLLVLAGVAYVIFLLAKQAMVPSTKLSAKDAAKLLDVKPDASAEDILAAHRRLIAKVHPDAGGSADLAARVNQARDTLLQQNSR